MARKPSIPQRPPNRRTSSSKHNPSRLDTAILWIIIVGVVLILLACGIAAALVGLPRWRQSHATPTSVTTTPDIVATSVAATMQAMPTSVGSGVSATATPNPATPTPNATVGATGVAPTPTTSPGVGPTVSPAIDITLQRDEDVDPATGISTWTEPAAGSEIRVMIRRADGTPLDKFVSAYPQGTDVSGNPVAEGSRVFGEWTGDDGVVTEGIAPGTYVLDFDVEGWPWTAQFANQVVNAGQRTNVLFDLSLLTVGLRYADGSSADKYVRVFLQDMNVNGDPVEGSIVEDGWTQDDGLITFELTPGIYALDIPDVEGHDDWGRFNHNLPGGGMYKVILTLGRLVVETWNPDGTLATNKYVQVYFLETDSMGNSALGDIVEDKWSNNTGQATFDLAPGFYGVEIDNEIQILDVPVQSEQVTTVDQTGYTLP